MRYQVYPQRSQHVNHFQSKPYWGMLNPKSTKYTGQYPALGT